MKRALVTGGTGVTGTALVRYLLDQNVEVVALVRKNSPRAGYLPKDERLHIVDCDMAEYRNIDGKLQKYLPVDVFFHLAWEGSRITDKIGSRDNMPLQAENIVHTIEAVELCHRMGCPVFLMTGTQAEFGKTDAILGEDVVSAPVNGYGSAKLCAETMTRIMCENYGIRHICARLFSVYGPFDGANSLVYTSIGKLISGEKPKYTKAEQKWDFLYSFDAAKALVLLAEKGKSGQMYCVANGESRPLHEYIEIIHKVCNPKIPPEFGEVAYGKNQVMLLGADISRLKADTGFEPEYSFEEGIRRTRDWWLGERKNYE
jgi:nucleoside-diphosphate-sugar epimerase